MKVMFSWSIYSCLIFGTGILCGHRVESRQQVGSSWSVSTEDTFSCSDGDYIEWSSVCDGQKDCLDGSDEIEKLCNRYEYGMNKTIECGRANVTGNQTKNALEGITPWNVGIYKYGVTGNYDFICGGSIIGPKFIISVAKCFYVSKNVRRLSIDYMYKVGVGKYVKNITKDDSAFIQLKSVEIVYLNDDFSESDDLFPNDIAVIVLSDKITFSNIVTPVCIDWNDNYNVLNGAQGKIVPWTLKKAPEIFLSETSLSYIDNDSCRNTYGLKYMTDDKFCASSAMEQKKKLMYFGAGLTFVHSNNSHFLTGIAVDSEKAANNSTIVYLTDVKYHINWIRHLYIKYLDHDIPFCILPAVEGVIYSYEGSNTILAHGTIINKYHTVIENCEVNYHKAYPRGLRVCQGNGKWSSTYEKLCIKRCPPLLSESVDIKCTLNGNFANCSTPSTPETIAVPSCKPTYTLPNGQEETPIELICQSNGMWNNQLYKCIPYCGKVYTNGNILIANGKKVVVGTAPWNVGIYQLNKDTSKYNLICGGSIIAQNLVVSAAHCFWYQDILSNKISINDDSYKVAIGKYDRNFTVADNEFTRIMNVESIYLNEHFSGAHGYYANDIAVIVLSDRVSFSNVVAPICIDWSGKYNVLNGVKGKIVGWGKTKMGTASSFLLETLLPYLDQNSCRDTYTNGFDIYVTLDKFCAGSTLVSEQDLDEGDSGSGLTFLHSKNYYLTGVLSLKEPSSNNSIALFTDIKHHIQWIRRLYNRHS